MKIVAISDVHVKKEGDFAYHLLIQFLQHPDVLNADAIFLLGDIFDLMIGPHSQYFSRFQGYFLALQNLLRLGKKIYYVEGNHDFHLKKLYEHFFLIHQDLNSSLFQMAAEFVIVDAGKKIHLSHGDEVEIENVGYRRYKSFVTSPPLTFYANYLMPYFLITKVGEKSSELSRKKNNKRYQLESDLAPVKEKFRRSASQYFYKHHYDLIVCGHSHVKDYFISMDGFLYVNNGYAQHSKTFICINDGLVSFQNIFLHD